MYKPGDTVVFSKKDKGQYLLPFCYHQNGELLYTDEYFDFYNHKNMFTGTGGIETLGKCKAKIGRMVLIEKNYGG